MLETISIKNYAIIDDITMDFGCGMNVLTGETGAGKSIIIDALGLILGERASQSMIRKNSAVCEITANFNISKNKTIKTLLDNMGIRGEDDLVIKREITADGKTRCFVNGTISTAGMLQTIGETLVDIHGQHEHQSLIKTENQRELLDDYGGFERKKSEIKGIYEKFVSVRDRLLDLKNSEKDRIQKLDLFKYQLKEIEEAKLSRTDESKLETEYTRLNNAEKLFKYAADIYSTLYESEGAAVEKLGIARKLLENLSSVDNSSKENLKLATTAIETVDALAENIRSYRDSIEFNPARLEEIISQMELLNKLKRKYAPTVKEITEYAENIRKQIDFFEKADENIAALEDELEKTSRELKKRAIELSSQRAVAAKKISKEIENELSELGMPKSKFFVSVEQEKDENGNYIFKSTGIDRIEYKISANPGEDLKPLKMVASGGEMSRIMLAIKTVLAKEDKTPTLIFDEIDAGLSGPMGQVVGKKLKTLSKNHQILCITHLAQLAAFSPAHFHIEKNVSGGKTSTSVEKLNNSAIAEEIARMLGGKNITETTKKHARELINEAK